MKRPDGESQGRSGGAPVRREPDDAGLADRGVGDRGVSEYLATVEEPDAISRPRRALVLHSDETSLAQIGSLVRAAGFEAVLARSAFAVADAPAPRLAILGLAAITDEDLEVLAYLRRRSPAATIVVLHPMSLRDRAAKALSAGADLSLQEPFYPAELTAIASRALERDRSSPEPDDPPTARSDAGSAVSDGLAAETAPIETGSVGHLAAGVADSIRHPLQSIELHLGAAETGGDVDVARMRAELRRIAGVVEGLTRFAGRAGAALRPSDVANLVTGVFMSRDVGAAGAEIAVRIGEARVEVLAAPDLLRAGLESLRNRAVRVTPPDGKISVRTRKRIDGGRRMVEISVCDGGPVLTADERARLFEPFPDEQSIEDGTGLELAALAGIVRDHGGAVSASVAGAVGTNIVIRLPVRDPSARTSSPAA